MKRILCLVLTMLLLASVAPSVLAGSDVTVKIDGNQIAFDVPPQLINSRTMVPLRAIFEALGASVEWNNDTQTVTSTKGDTTIKLTINKSVMYVNGNSVTLDSPACLVNGRTLVPVRAISEAFKCDVKWDDKTWIVYITSNSELCIKGHEWEEATCTVPKKCVRCKIEEGDPIGHKLSDSTIIKVATCSEYGIKKSICTVCLESVDVNIPLIDHVVSDWSVIPTETQL